MDHYKQRPPSAISNKLLVAQSVARTYSPPVIARLDRVIHGVGVTNIQGFRFYYLDFNSNVWKRIKNRQRG